MTHTILNRRSIRNFKSLPVEEEKINKILEAAMSAPTACNQREWEFIVVDDSNILKQLSNCSPYASPAKNAPLAIVVTANKNLMNHPHFFEQDLAAATENILLESFYLGLGSVWLGIAPNQERMKNVREVLNLPDYIKPFSIVPLGYPMDTPKEIHRMISTRIHKNKYTPKEGEFYE